METIMYYLEVYYYYYLAVFREILLLKCNLLRIRMYIIGVLLAVLT